MKSKPGRPRSEAADRAINRAVMKSLVEHGFSGTTMTGIARLAGVSTATLYRRFNNLNDAIVSALADQVATYQAPDTGSIEDDLKTYLGDLADELFGGLGRLMPALIDAAYRNPDLAQALDEHVSAPGRLALSAMFKRAIDRGEIRPDVNIELATDFIIGPLYVRRLGMVRPLSPGTVDELSELALAALRPTTTGARTNTKKRP